MQKRSAAELWFFLILTRNRRFFHQGRRYMKLFRCVLLVVCAVALVASCSSLPQTTRTPDEMASIRTEYLETHPDGKYNDCIMEGRVVKGMNVLEVLASWGLPNARRGWQHDKTEYWTYNARDEHTKEMVSYELIFDDRVLSKWVVSAADVATLGSASGEVSTSARTVQETLQLGNATSGTETNPKKK